MSQILDYKANLINTLRHMDEKFDRIELLAASPLNLLGLEHRYCAIGGLYKLAGVAEWKIQTGLGYLFSRRSLVRDMLGIPKGTWYKCPKCFNQCSLISLAVHLNDNHHLSFKENAVALESAVQIERPKTHKEWFMSIAQQFSQKKKISSTKEAISEYVKVSIMGYIVFAPMITLLPFAFNLMDSVLK